MKVIEETDLSTALRKKINQFENIKSSNISNNYISYENDNFVSKELSTDKYIYSVDDIYKLSDHLYKSENNYVSAYDTVMVDNNNSYASSALLSSLKGSFLFKLDSNIVKFKSYDSFFLILCESGKLYKINKNNCSIQTSKNVIDILKNNFIFDASFNAFCISDFIWYDNGILISTPYNGIFYISFVTNEFSLKIKELNVKIIKLLSDGKTLVIATDFQSRNIILYDIESDKKIAIYNNLYLTVQDAIDVDIDTDSFYILGKTYSVNQSEHLLHVWQLNSTKTEYELKDYFVSKNKSDNIYRPKILKHTTTNIYICGIKNKKIFLWEYDKSKLNSSPVELNFNIQDIEYDDLIDFNKINNRFYITLKNQLIVLDNNLNLLENYLLGGTAKFNFVKVTRKGIYAIDGKDVYSYSIPAKNYQKITDITILNETTLCNNIDVFIKMSSDNQVLFLNGETGQKFNPYFYMKLENQYHIIKITNNNYKKIIMRIGVNESSKIDGIVIHKNRIFYK